MKGPPCGLLRGVKPPRTFRADANSEFSSKMILATVSRAGKRGGDASDGGKFGGLAGVPGGNIPSSDKSIFEISDIYNGKSKIKSKGGLVQERDITDSFSMCADTLSIFVDSLLS